MDGGGDGEFSMLRRCRIDGVELLRARFIRHRYPRHAHESATVALMDAGIATFNYRGEDFTVGPGDVFLLNPDTVHTGRPASSEGYLYRVLYLDAVALRPLLASAIEWPPDLCFRQTILHDPMVADLLRRTHDALAAEEQGLRPEELLLRLSRTLLTRYGHADGAQAPDTKSGHGVGRRASGVAAAQEYLEAHPAEKVLLRDLAAVACTSPHRLVRMFSAQVGMPPHAYQTQLRVRLARRLLVAGSPVARVASQAGFCDQAHLSRVFKSYTGVTPTQFSAGVRCSG